MKYVLYFLAVASMVAAGIFIGYLIWRPKELKSIKTYIPVDVWYPKYVGKPAPYPVATPPHIINHYMSYEDSMILVLLKDSLFTLVSNVTKHDTIRIKSGFLTAFPTQPKLIDADIRMDSIDLTLLNINTDLFTKRYPLDLFNYRYRFDGVNMSSQLLKHPWAVPGVSKWELGLNGYIGDDLLKYPKIIPAINLELEISYSKIRFRMEPEMTIEKSPQLGINAKIGYGIWHRPKN
jgi:hypothetical protein